MIKVTNKLHFLDLFESYTHNLPVIYSSLEGQYNGELYVDSESSPHIALLYTPFGFHYVAGDPNHPEAATAIEQCLFQEYLPLTGQKEAILFSPNENWDNQLGIVFQSHRGVKDGRNIFRLNKEHFKEILRNHITQPEVVRKIAYEHENESQTEYPVCRVFVNDHCVSFCSAFMLGKGHAEIDVFTEEDHRGKGYAKEASLGLIEALLEKQIEPDWCTWPYRVESEKLAYSLGFELKAIVPAHIWFKDAEEEMDNVDC